MTKGKKGMTRNQSLVFDVLKGSEAPLSAYGILDRLRSSGLRAPLQVYRALDKLVELGVVHRLESMNAFVACSDSDCHDTGPVAFAICESCGGVSEFADKEVTARLSAWTGKNGFAANKTAIEIRGVCATCSG